MGLSRGEVLEINSGLYTFPNGLFGKWHFEIASSRNLKLFWWKCFANTQNFLRWVVLKPCSNYEGKGWLTKLLKIRGRSDFWIWVNINAISWKQNLLVAFVFLNQNTPFFYDFKSTDFWNSF
jgi:hypothetical protein